MNKIKYYLPGTILILTALLILVLPQILVAFAAAFIILAGIGALKLGHRIRKEETRLEQVFVHDDDLLKRYINVFYRRL